MDADRISTLRWPRQAFEINHRMFHDTETLFDTVKVYAHNSEDIVRYTIPSDQFPPKIETVHWSYYSEKKDTLYGIVKIQEIDTFAYAFIKQKHCDTGFHPTTSITLSGTYDNIIQNILTSHQYRRYIKSTMYVSHLDEQRSA